MESFEQIKGDLANQFLAKRVFTRLRAYQIKKKVKRLKVNKALRTSRLRTLRRCLFGILQFKVNKIFLKEAFSYVEAKVERRLKSHYLFEMQVIQKRSSLAMDHYNSLLIMKVLRAMNSYTLYRKLLSQLKQVA